MYLSIYTKQKSNYSQILYFILIFLLINLLSAKEIKNSQYQIEIIPKWYTTNNHVIQGPLGLESKNNSITQDKFYIRPSLSHSFDDSDWATRIGLYMAYNYYPELQDSFELRPYFGLNYYHTYSDIFDKISINLYIRAEERYHYDVENKNKIEQHFRARLKASCMYNFHDGTKTNSWRRIILSGEVLRTYLHTEEQEFTLEKKFEVESRITLGIERILEENERIRFEVSWNYQVPFNEISDAKSHTFSFKISYTPIWGDILSNSHFGHADE